MKKTKKNRSSRPRPAERATTPRRITDRKRAEEALRESEASFRELAESIGDVFFAMDRDLRCTYWNKASQALTGIPADQVLGKSLYDLFPDIKGTIREALYLRVLRTHRAGTVAAEYRVRGEPHFFEISAYHSRRGLSVFARDVTECKRAEETLRQSEERYRTLVANSPTFICTHDLAGAILSVNPAAAEALECAPSELIGKNLSDWLAPAGRDRLDDYLAAIRQQPALNDLMRVVTKTGKERTWIYFNARCDPPGQPPFVIGNAVDITDRRRMDLELQQSEERFQLAAEATNDIVWDYRPGTDSTWRGKGVQTVLGYPYDGKETKAEWWIERLHPEDKERVLAASERAQRTGTWEALEYRFRRADGSWAHLLDRGHVIHDKSGRVVRIVGAMTDLTERKRAEEALLRQRRQLRLLSEAGRRVNSVLEIPAVMRTLIASALELLEAEAGTAGLVSGGKMVFREYNRIGEVPAAIDYSFPPGYGVPGWVLETGKPYVTNDPEHDPHVMLEIRNALGFFNLAAAPILGRSGEVIGCLWIHNKSDRRAFDGHDVQMLQGLAAAAAIALENASAQEDLKRTMHLNRILLDAFPCVALLLRPQTREIVASNAAAVKAGAVPGARCYSTWGQRQDPCPWCLAPTLWATGEAQHLEVEALGVCWDAHWIPVADDLYMHFAFDITESKRAEEALRKLSGRLLHIQDEERRRIARELHDGTAQNLTALAMNLNLLLEDQDGLDAQGCKTLADSLNLARRSLSEIRSLSYLLHPPLLDELGLAEALGIYAAGFSQRTGIHVDLRISPQFPRLPSEVETTLFRIVQESLSNVQKHSGSPGAEIRIQSENGEATLEVEDHGRGMRPAGAQSEDGDVAPLGVGITGMRERARQLGGHLEIRSDGGGVTVSARLPLRTKEP